MDTEEQPEVTGFRLSRRRSWRGLWRRQISRSPPSYHQGLQSLSSAASMLTLHRDLTIQLGTHVGLQAVYFIKMKDQPAEGSIPAHRSPEYWFRCKPPLGFLYSPFIGTQTSTPGRGPECRVVLRLAFFRPMAGCVREGGTSWRPIGFSNHL